ncbi:type III-E CRISPR-associated gRAMP effector Cas7-11e [Desulfonema magnum]|uniref:CRISPR type III-associated protein domain-containing protein n=2 Tax=Desulfonema magnum TaxID=45655 RepID=A0A975GRY4_9BACT|nr:type III-E CRISPR-associated gRAMP effector Cas7-11 [Desulfonema magnum]QTA90448.1 CRISPR type III-associated protein domain-containing protein [Desulfonema magnum]
MQHIIPLTITFLESFRVIEWHKSSDRNSLRFLRGYAYARWHRSLKNNKGRPYITGTLVRSAIIRAAEELLWLNDGNYKGAICCPGEFNGSNAKVFREGKARRLRRRQTLTWPTKCACHEKEPCPFCLLLGRYEKSSKTSKSPVLNNVNFSNFNVLGKEKEFLNIEDVADMRVVNRVDQQSGKAEDFFNIWEITDGAWKIFRGEIQVSDKGWSDEENFSKFLTLLKGASVLVDKISGGLCYLTLDKPELAELPAVKTEKDVLEPGDDASVLEISRPPYWNNMLNLAGTISEAFEREDKLVHLRLFADTVRELRRSDIETLDLPKGHADRLGKPSDHFIWDIEINKKVKLRNWLFWIFNEFRDTYAYFDWRTFCEALGQALYLEAKKQVPNQFSSERPVGATPAMEVKTPEHDPGRAAQGPRYEWLIKGELVSQTPFFFGWSTEADNREHTNLKLLAARDGRLRLPLSVLRGILRRDIKVVLDNKCRAELAMKQPCSCPVCNLMKKITIRDSFSSNYAEPPKIRHKIRLDPKSGTVAKGALFDSEVGPRGVVFPFELRLRSADDTLPQALKTVFSWWQQGTVSFSGDAGTGKGIFCLRNLKSIRWDLKTEMDKYAATLGGRKTPVGKWDKCHIPDDKTYPWVKETVEISVCSPFITKDPVNSLIDSAGYDAICYTTVDLEKSENINSLPESEISLLFEMFDLQYPMSYLFPNKDIYLLKGESFRGMLRTAVGRGENLLLREHEDCSCTLCRIFGNEHNAGKIRVEDFIIQGEPRTKLVDRVAIDRFTAGAKDKFKFDAAPIVGTPTNKLKFRGNIWIHRDLDGLACESLKLALEDIENGLYPFGGLGNAGFGWVNYNPLSHPAQEENKADFSLTKKMELNWSMKELSTDKIYWPHYFLPFGKKVLREKTPPSHACIDENEDSELYSGKIVCTLETRTPLIIPDSEFQGEEHKSYDFFNLNGELCIPGSEIRGMISSVFEALTNSCMRIFDEKKRLSWRMNPNKKDKKNNNRRELDDFIPGRVTNDRKMEEMKEYRYPFYDQAITANDKQNKYFDQWEATIELTDESLEKLKAEKILQSVLDALRPLTKKKEKYKNTETFVFDLKKFIGKIDDNQQMISEALERGKVRLTGNSLKQISKTKKIPRQILNQLKGLKDNTYENREQFISVLKTTVRGINDEQISLILDNIDEDVRLTDLSLTKIRKAKVPQTLVDMLADLKKDEPYKNEKEFLSEFKKKMGEIIGLILKHAAKTGGDVPRYNHPTPTDKMLLSLAAYNRNHKHENGKAEYRIVKPKHNLKVDFMFAVTPFENPFKGYNPAAVVEEPVGGYLKVSGPNKIEKVKKVNPNSVSVRDDKNQEIIHNGVYLRKITVANAKSKNKLRERLVPEFAWYDKDSEAAYAMTKRCERVFVEIGAKPIPIQPSAREKFKILTQEYQKNAKQQKTPEAFQTILPKDGELRPGDLVYFREDKKTNTVTDIIPVRISRTVDDEVLARKIPDDVGDVRPCVREILDKEKQKEIADAGVKEVFQHHPDGLCPACSLFGTTFYKGRIAFGFAFHKDKDPELANNGKHITLPLLERPRPTWSMPKKESRVPGRKFYVHHQGWERVIKHSNLDESDPNATKQTVNNRSVQAIKEEQKFQFEVRFENLREWELGLLVYVLQLEPQFAHKLGMGKALGFGSVRIRVGEIHSGPKELDESRLVSSAMKKMEEIWDRDKNVLEKLFRLLYFNESKDIKVRYPKLQKEKEEEEEESGYMELAKEEYQPEQRRNKLTNPWEGWGNILKKPAILI